MAIGVRITFPGLSQDAFDTAHDHINPGREAPKGLIFHASGPVDGGYGVIDFWESRADFEAFQAQIPAGIAASGVQLPAPPDVVEFAVHEFIHP